LAGSRWLIWSYGLVALFVLILFGRGNPMATLLLGTWLPLPLLLVGWRLGTWAAALLALAAALLVFALNPGVAVFQENLGLWMILLMALILTFCHHRGWPEGSGIIMTVAALGLLGLVFFLGQAFFEGLSPAALWEQKSRELTEALARMFQEAGMSFSDLRLMGLPRVDVEKLLIQVLPALALINLSLVAWVNILVVQRLGTLWGWDDLGAPLSQWASPEWLVFFLVGAGFALLAPLLWVRQAGLNLLLVMGFVYFCQGLAVISALLQRHQLPWVLRGLVYILAFMNPLLLVVMILGLTDLWLDFRTLQPPRET
jgi:uncharacterized protein YybS (DUF2232 family)